MVANQEMIRLKQHTLLTFSEIEIEPAVDEPNPVLDVAIQTDMTAIDFNAMTN